MSDHDLIVRNARIVTEDRLTEGDIAVRNGCIAAIGNGVQVDQVVFQIVGHRLLDKHPTRLVQRLDQPIDFLEGIIHGE